MSTKENFVKALRELTGFDESDSQGGAQGAERMKIDPVKMEIGIPEIKENEFSSSFTDSYAEITRSEFGSSGEEGRTHIPSGMRIIGNVDSKDRIEMIGRVEGDIVTAGDAIITGAVVGSIKANHLLLQNAAVKGDLTASGDVTIERGAMVIGDISAQNIKLDGKVKGDITVSQMAELTSGAVVNGNIETATISTSRGTKIKGNILTKQTGDFDVDAEFNIEV